MKKLLLSSFAIFTAFAVNAQNPTGHIEDFDSTSIEPSPCFVSWPTGFTFQGSAGHDFTKMTWNSVETTAELTVKTHASNHGPYYYPLTGGTKADCTPHIAKTKVDISAMPKFSIRMKATQAMRVNVYVQEGNDPSWDYSKFSAASVQADVTTSYQTFEITVADTSGGGAAVDLTNIGGIAFELGKTDGLSVDNVDGTVSIDYIKFGDRVVSTQAVTLSSTAVYPNPAGDVVNVSVGSTSTVELANLAGQVVAAGASNGAGVVTLNTASVPAGVYVVSVKSDAGVATSKVVVQ